MVLRRLWRFMKRHKGKIFAFSAVTAGVYMSLTYLRSKLEELREKQMAEAFDIARKQAHYESNQRTCNTTVLSLIPSMREMMMSELDCEKMTELLQSKPSNKLHIWSELKILAFTRAFLSIYSTCILTLTLRVQLNIIGGYMYAGNVREGLISSVDNKLYDKYLGSIQCFLRRGIHRLCDTVQRNVERELISCSLKRKMTPETLHQTVDSIRKSVEGGDVNGGPVGCSAFAEYIIPDIDSTSLAQGELSLEAERLLSEIILETNDILQSEDYRVVLQECIQHGFDTLLRIMDHTFPGQGVDDGVALAKLIPPVAFSIHVICPDAADKYIQELFSLRCLGDFGQQVYTAFSKPVLVNQLADNQ